MYVRLHDGCYYKFPAMERRQAKKRIPFFLIKRICFKTPLFQIIRFKLSSTYCMSILLFCRPVSTLQVMSKVGDVNCMKLFHFKRVLVLIFSLLF